MTPDRSMTPEEPTKTRGPCDEIKACLDDNGLVMLRLGIEHL